MSASVNVKQTWEFGRRGFNRTVRVSTTGRGALQREEQCPQLGWGPVQQSISELAVHTQEAAEVTLCKGFLRSSSSCETIGLFVRDTRK